MALRLGSTGKGVVTLEYGVVLQLRGGAVIAFRVEGGRALALVITAILFPTSMLSWQEMIIRRQFKTRKEAQAATPPRSHYVISEWTITRECQSRGFSCPSPLVVWVLTYEIPDECFIKQSG